MTLHSRSLSPWSVTTINDGNEATTRAPVSDWNDAFMDSLASSVSVSNRNFWNKMESSATHFCLTNLAKLELERRARALACIQLLKSKFKAHRQLIERERTPSIPWKKEKKTTKIGMRANERRKDCHVHVECSTKTEKKTKKSTRPTSNYHFYRESEFM